MKTDLKHIHSPELSNVLTAEIQKVFPHYLISSYRNDACDSLYNEDLEATVYLPNNLVETDSDKELFSEFAISIQTKGDNDIKTYDYVKEVIEALRELEKSTRKYKITMTRTIVTYTEIECTRSQAEKIAKASREIGNDLDKRYHRETKTEIECISNLKA